MRFDRRGRRKFADEFNRDAVDLVLTTRRPIAEVADKLWIHDSPGGTGSAVTRTSKLVAAVLDPDERASFRELGEGNAQLLVEHDLLHRTVAWVKVSPQ